MVIGKNKRKKANKKPSITKAGKLPIGATVKCKGVPLKSGTVGTYGDLLKKTGDGQSDRDHIPSSKALEKRARALNNDQALDAAQKSRVKRSGLAIVVPKSIHKLGRTYGGKNTAAQSDLDARDLAAAARKDILWYKKLKVSNAIAQQFPRLILTNAQYTARLKACLKG